MESVYERGRRSWISEKICLGAYFSTFSAAIPTINSTENTGSNKNADVERNTSIWNLMDIPFTDDEIRILSETCSINQLQVPDEPSLVDVKCVKARPGLFDKCKIPAAASDLETLKCLSKRIVNEKTIGHLKYRSNIWLTDAVHKTQNLEIGKHFIVTVRVYHPFRHRVGIRNSHPPRCSQEIVLLGDQMLTDLRDKIVCASDLAVSGELSENPDKNFTQRTMDVYKSGFIFIEDTFYNDHRDPANLDYSRVIREWAVSHDLGPFRTASMENTKFEDLTVRLGYPYVYQHQGNCEHLIVFSDVRLLHKNDPLSSQSYPILRSTSSTNARYCMICNFYVARWITCENERVPFDPCFFCEHCFRSYNYIDGKKVGHFKAYPFFDRTAV